jgi:hypothetical protein
MTTIDDKTFFRENPLRCYRARLATSHEAFQRYGMLDAKAQHDVARGDRFVHVIVHWDRQKATVQKLFLVTEPLGDMDESQAKAAFERRDAETVVAGKVESFPPW